MRRKLKARRWKCVCSRELELGAENCNHIIGGDYAGERAVFIYDGQGEQVVFVEDLRDLALIGLIGAGDQRISGQFREARV